MHLITKANVFIFFPLPITFIYQKKGRRQWTTCIQILAQALTWDPKRWRQGLSILVSAIPSRSKTGPGWANIRECLFHELMSDRCPGKYGEGVGWLRGLAERKHHCETLGPAHGWASMCVVWRLKIGKSRTARNRCLWGHRGCQQSSWSLEDRLHLLNYRCPLATRPLPCCN